MRPIAVFSVFIILQFSCIVYAGKTCSSIADCACGEQCISKLDRTPCDGSSTCRCREGCVVGNVYLRQGKTWQNVHCNRCSCHKNPSVTNGKAFCTRSTWCDLPRDKPIYPENPNCNERVLIHAVR